MKLRAKTISLLLAVCMMITLMPAVAMAAGEDSVNIGNKTLNSKYSYYVNGENGAVGEVYEKEEDIPVGKSWNAMFDSATGTLTLNNLNIVNVRQGEENDGIRGIRWQWDDLTIVLQAGSENIVTNTRGAAIVCDTSGSLTLIGDGILYATGSTSGIWVWDNITIGGNVKVYATGVTKYGIANNENLNTTITIKDNAQVIADGSRGDSTVAGKRYGIGCEDYYNANTTIKIEGNSSLTAFGVDGAIQNGIDSCYKSSIAAATNVNGDGATAIASSGVTDNHKYIAVNNALTLPRYYVFFDRNVAPTAPNPNAPAMAAQSVTSGSLTLNNYTGLTEDAFIRWDTKASGDGTSYANQATLTPVRSMILYAQETGTAPAYEVTFIPNGGSGSMAAASGVSGAYLLPHNGFTAPANKQFKCWSVDGVEKNPSDVITVSGNVTVTAVWEDIPTTPTTYTVTYDPNGGTGTMASETVDSVTGSGFVFPSNQFTAPAGKQFKCWEVNGATKDPGDHIDVSSDITVKAVWEDISTGGGNTPPNTDDPGTTTPTVSASSGISLWYEGGNSFGSSNSAVPTSVEIDNVPVSFSGNGSKFTVGCISPNAKWVTVNWNSTSVTTNFTPDANAVCTEISLPKTGDVSVMAFALMAVIAAAGAMGKK